MIDTVSIHNNDVFIWIESDRIEFWLKCIESNRIVSSVNHSDPTRNYV